MLNTIRVWVGTVALTTCAAPAAAESVTLLRVILNDGTAVVSYGEYARVGDRLIFSMPIGKVDKSAIDQPTLHVVNMPLSAVNWTATEKYAEAARYSHYVETKAEVDYAALAGEVASVLNAVVLAKDPKGRLSLAVDARRRLASWPKEHYGYRAEDVHEMLGLLDEAISALRAAAGETSFAIDLVAATAPERRDPAALMRAPTAAEAITQAIAVAKAIGGGPDRVSILRSVIAALDDPRNRLEASWARPMRRWATHAIAQETRAEKQYAALTSTSLKRAATAASNADVRGVERVLASVAWRDVQLGRKRPEEINALIDQVKLQLDAARRLRLARDSWQERTGAFRAYMRVVDPIVAGMTRASRNLDDIKGLAGSDPAVLLSLGDRFATNTRTLSIVSVPDELKPAHALLVSAVNLAETAVRTRRQAVASGELQVAWDASSAAAGSMMLLKKAREDMKTAIRLPEIR